MAFTCNKNTTINNELNLLFVTLKLAYEMLIYLNCLIADLVPKTQVIAEIKRPNEKGFLVVAIG